MGFSCFDILMMKMLYVESESLDIPEVKFGGHPCLVMKARQTDLEENIGCQGKREIIFSENH